MVGSMLRHKMLGFVMLVWLSVGGCGSQAAIEYEQARSACTAVMSELDFRAYYSIVEAAYEAGESRIGMLNGVLRGCLYWSLSLRDECNTCGALTVNAVY